MLNDEAANLRSRYSEHVGRWTLAAIDRDKASYSQAAAELIRQVRAHLRRKQAVLPLWRQAVADVGLDKGA